jgi:hypothetical protein
MVLKYRLSITVAQSNCKFHLDVVGICLEEFIVMKPEGAKPGAEQTSTNIRVTPS